MNMTHTDELLMDCPIDNQDFDNQDIDAEEENVDTTEYDEELAYLEFILSAPPAPRNVWTEPARCRFPRPVSLPRLDKVPEVVYTGPSLREVMEKAAEEKKAEELRQIAAEEARKTEQARILAEQEAEKARKAAADEKQAKLAAEKAAGWDVVPKRERAAPKPEPRYEPKRDEVFAKTKMCESVATGEKCRHGDRCRYAHSKAELVIPVCKFGDRCRYVTQRHGEYVNQPGQCCTYKHPGEASSNYHARQARSAPKPAPQAPSMKPIPPPARIPQPPEQVIRVPKEHAAQAMAIAAKSGRNVRIEII
jgi:hypothetical protein